MKKTYFNPALVRRGHLPTIVSRRIFGHSSSNNANVSYLSDGDEGEEGERKILLKKVKETVSEGLATRATKEELKLVTDQLTFLSKKNEDGSDYFPLEALRKMADAEKGAMAVLAAQGLELTRLETVIKNQPKDLSIRSQVASWMEKNKEAIKKIRHGGEAANLAPFELEFERRAAASPMLPSTVMPGGSSFITRYEVAPGIVDPLRREPTFWDHIKKGTTNAETYIWLNKVVPADSGAAGFIGPGVYKPALSFTITKESSFAKKIAANEKMATELLEDIDGFASYVENELRFKVMEKLNEQLMSGTASSTSPAGLQSLSVPYNPLTGVSTTNANNWDAIKACVTQLRVSLFKGPIQVYMNPVDIANAVMTKAQNQGQLFIPPVTGAEIVEDMNTALGYMQVVASDYYKLLIYKPFSIRWGWENDDFTNNLVTVIGEMRLHQFHSSNHDGFAIYDTIANVISAIDIV